MNSIQRIGKNLIALSITKFSIVILSIFLSIYIARLLGDIELGKYYLIKRYCFNLPKLVEIPSGKNILVLAPSFVTDCLETLIEVGEDYQKFFKNSGGKIFQLVESLNASDTWISALAEIINDALR